MKLDILLRTHDRSDVHPIKSGRYCSDSKLEVIKRCLASLIKSCNQVYNHELNIIILDDHSTHSLIDYINNIIPKSIHPIKLINLDVSGNNNSYLFQLETAKNSNADLVYLIEDDYLHFESALFEMIEDYINFSKHIGQNVAIYPFDDPINYVGKYIEDSKVVLGCKRHWRTNTYSTGSFMINPKIIRDNFDIYYKFCKLYMTPFGYALNIHEGTTINKIWREQVYLFTPIPSLALHMQYDEQKDKFLDWKELWDKSIL